MLPWFQSILDLAPTEQWRCSLRSKYNYRNKGIQFLRFCHFYPKCKLQVGGWEQAVHKVSAGFGLVCHAYKHKLQVVLLQSRLPTMFWRSLWSRQNEIQPSVLLKLAHAASKRCRKSKSKGRITFCAPECFSWSTWHSAVGCVFRFVGSKFRVATLL